MSEETEAEKADKSISPGRKHLQYEMKLSKREEKRNLCMKKEAVM